MSYTTRDLYIIFFVETRYYNLKLNLCVPTRQNDCTYSLLVCYSTRYKLQTYFSPRESRKALHED